MGCGSSDTKINNKNIREKHKEVFEKLNFADIKSEDLDFYIQKKLIYYQKSKGYRILIEETIFHLNNALKGAFEDQRDKERAVLKLVYIFFSRHNSRSLLEDFKKKTLLEILNHNKSKILYFWYFVESYARIINYLLIQSLCPCVLPNEEDDLELFFGGHSVENTFGKNSPTYVGNKIKEMFSEANLHNTEFIIKDYCMNKADIDYIMEMISLEKRNEQLPEEYRELLEINEDFLLQIHRKFCLFFNPFTLFEIYVGNHESIDFLKGAYSSNIKRKELDEYLKSKKSKIENYLEKEDEEINEINKEIINKVNNNVIPENNVMNSNDNKNKENGVEENHEKFGVNEISKNNKKDNSNKVIVDEVKYGKNKVKVIQHKNRMFDFLNDKSDDEKEDV